MKNILIAVHSPKIRSIIEKNCNKLFKTCSVTYSDNYSLSIFTMINTTIDVFIIEDYLNYEHSESTMGFQLMAKIRENEKYKFTPIFFFSNLEKSILYAYEEFHCFTCYEYPFDVNSFVRNVKIAISFQSPRGKNKRLNFKKDGLIYPISTQKILYIQSNRQGTYLQCIQNTVEEFPYRSCKQLLDLLDSTMFVQCNKSTIINKNQIKSIDLSNRTIIMNNLATGLELGLAYKDNLYRALEIT